MKTLELLDIEAAALYQVIKPLVREMESKWRRRKVSTDTLSCFQGIEIKLKNIIDKEN